MDLHAKEAKRLFDPGATIASTSLASCSIRSCSSVFLLSTPSPDSPFLSERKKSFRYLQCCKLGKKERKQIFAQQLTFRFWFRQLHRFLWWRLIKLSQHPVYHRDAGLLLDRVRKSTKKMSNLKNISFCFGVHILTEGAL